MKIGASIFPTDTSIQPIELGEALEERGFESIWFPEHSHIPTSRTTPWGGRSDAPPLPEHYWRTHDQFIALSAIAARTERLKVATGITLVAQRDPIWLAKMAASLDRLSGGRFMLGVGYGWNKEEMAHHGVAYGQRRELVHEKVRLIQRLWTEDIASFAGEMLHLEPSWAWPKPVQTPHPPVIFGGGPGPRLFAAIVELGDGWIPAGNLRDLARHMEDLRATAAAAGRDPSTIEVSVFGGRPDPARIEEWSSAGVDRVALELPQAPADEVVKVLDRYRPLIGELA